MEFQEYPKMLYHPGDASVCRVVKDAIEEEAVLTGWKPADEPATGDAEADTDTEEAGAPVVRKKGKLK